MKVNISTTTSPKWRNYIGRPLGKGFKRCVNCCDIQCNGSDPCEDCIFDDNNIVSRRKLKNMGRIRGE